MISSFGFELGIGSTSVILIISASCIMTRCTPRAFDCLLQVTSMKCLKLLQSPSAFCTFVFFGGSIFWGGIAFTLWNFRGAKSGVWSYAAQGGATPAIMWLDGRIEAQNTANAAIGRFLISVHLCRLPMMCCVWKDSSGVYSGHQPAMSGAETIIAFQIASLNSSQVN